MINVNDMSKEQLWKLREEIVLGSLFMSDFENSYDIDPKAVQDFFDAFVEDCILQMTEKGMSADDAWDAFIDSGGWDNAEKLYDYYLSVEYPFGDFEIKESLDKEHLTLDGATLDTIKDFIKNVFEYMQEDEVELSDEVSLYAKLTRDRENNQEITFDVIENNNILDSVSGYPGSEEYCYETITSILREQTGLVKMSEAVEDKKDMVYSEILNAKIKVNPGRHPADAKMFCGTYFIGTYMEGDLAGKEYVFVVADSEGHRFMHEYMGYPIDKNGFVDQPTDIIVSGGKDDVYFMVDTKDLLDGKDTVKEELNTTGASSDEVEFYAKDIYNHFNGEYDVDIVGGYKIHIIGTTEDLTDEVENAKYVKANKLQADTQRMADGTYVYMLKPTKAKSVDEAIVMNEVSMNDPNFDEIEKALLNVSGTSKVEFDYRPNDGVYKYPENHFIVLVFNDDTVFGDGLEYFKNYTNWKREIVGTLKSLGWKLEDPLEDNGTYIYLVMEKIKDSKNEGYELVNPFTGESNGIKVEVYSDYETAKSRALMLGLKEAEYGDEFGTDIAYCAWNKSGDRNEEAVVLAYYRFENGKPVALTDEEKATVENVKDLTFDDITGPIKEGRSGINWPSHKKQKLAQLKAYLDGLEKHGEYGMTKATPEKIADLKQQIKDLEMNESLLKESSLQKGEHEISDTELLTWGWEKGYNGGVYYVEKIYLPSPNSDMWSTEFHRTYATEEAARRAFNRYKKQYSLTEGVDSTDDFDTAYAIFATSMDKASGDEKIARDSIITLVASGGIKRTRCDYIIKHWSELLDAYNKKETATDSTVLESNAKADIPEYIWSAVCSANPADYSKVEKYLSRAENKNKTYLRFGREHSLIMGAARNNNWKMVKFLISQGVDVLPDEKEEFEYLKDTRVVPIELYEDEYLKYTKKDYDPLDRDPLTWMSADKRERVKQFNDRMAELCREKGYIGEAEVKAELKKYIKNTDTDETLQSAYVYDFIDSIVDKNGADIPGEDRDNLEDYYLNIVYSDPSFCAHLENCKLDESWWAEDPEEHGFTVAELKALPKIYGYFAFSSMTGITHVVFSKDRKNLIGIEDKFAELINYAGDPETEEELEAGVKELADKDTYVINSEGPFDGREITEYKLADGSNIWVLTDKDGTNYRIEEVAYDSWRF